MSQLFQIIEIAGNDARSFLQGQLTQDMNELDDRPALLAAWCDPRGRVIVVVRVIATATGAALAVPSGLADAVAGRLSMYRLRARVEITRADWSALAVSSESDLAALAAAGLLPAERHAAARGDGIVTVDTGAPSRVVELYAPAAVVQRAGLHSLQLLSSDEWQLAWIEAGLPLIDGEASAKYTPHMLNLDCLDAISFTKGCYTGQEVVARTQHLGKSKRRLMHYRTGTGEVRPGDKLRQGDRDVGTVVTTADDHLLAVVPVELHSETLSVGGTTASPVGLPYALPS